jgi:hypothetical protein
MAEVNLAENNGGALLATAGTFLALSLFSVILRSYVRIYLTNGFQPDDWVMLAAQVKFLFSRR